MDASGNIYISDNGNNRIRKVDGSGIITTIAGTGGSGYSGDGGLATFAQIGNPGNMIFDSNGNLYFVDSWNALIRKINTSGIINKIAGTGIAGYSGDGGPANLAQIDPAGLCTDANGNIYLSETTKSRIRIICFSSCAMGLEEQQNLADIKLYPNPANNYLHLETEGSAEIMEVSICNTLGQNIATFAYSKQLDVSSLSSGCYFVKIIKDGKSVYYSKFVKE